MCKSSVTPDVVTYNALISTCARAQDPNRAEAWLEADAVSYCMTIDACVRAGDVQRAEQWLHRMEASNLQASDTCYGTFMNALSKTGDYQSIERIMTRMWEQK